MSHPSSLRDHVLMLRRDAIHRSDRLFFRPIPLFVLIAHSMEDGAIYGCIEHAIDDGYGDPEDLDPCDERQTSRLESAMLDKATSLDVQELITIEYQGWPGGLQYALCIAEIGEEGVLVLHHSHDVPSFQAFAHGDASELLAELRDSPAVLLPRLQEENDRIAQVVIRQQLHLTSEDITLLVLALTGIAVHDDHLVRADLLLGATR